MATNGSLIANAVEQLIVSNVLTPLSQWLKSAKGVDATVQEMAQVLNLPATSTPKAIPNGLPQNVPLQMPNMQMPGPQMGGIPSYLNGGAIGGMPLGVQQPSRNSRTKAVDPNYTGPTCQYRYSRGAKNGQFCGQPCIPNSNFCKECVKKKSGGGQGATNTNLGNLPNISGFTMQGAMPQQQLFQQPGMANIPQQPQQQPQAQPQEEIEALPIQGRPGFFKETNHGFIIQQSEDPNDQSLYVRGIEVGGQTRKLNQQEQQLATKIGFVVDPTQVDITQGVQQQQAPAIPTLSALGNIGAPNAFAMPQPVQQFAPQQQVSQFVPQQQVPQIPQIPSLVSTPQQGVPSIPSIGGLSGLPSIPQISGLPQMQSVGNLPNIPSLTPLPSQETPKSSSPAVPTPTDNNA